MLMIILLPQPNFLWRQHVYLGDATVTKSSKGKKTNKQFFVNMRFHLTTFDLKYVPLKLCFCSFHTWRFSFLQRRVHYFHLLSKAKKNKQTDDTSVCKHTFKLGFSMWPGLCESQNIPKHYDCYSNSRWHQVIIIGGWGESVPHEFQHEQLG